ncbi:MAG TPA: hypothetical protein VMY41_12900 [Thermohalobaculum sp.]|nr:hypothetical protein [Thermohalobaculum sp.]
MADVADSDATTTPLLHRSVIRQILQLLGTFVLIDGVILLVCPLYGGDCLYGFRTLIAFPVMLSGPAGVLLPRAALRYGRDRRSRALIWIAGGLLLLAVVTICHVVAIRLLNFADYGEVLVRHRLLAIGLGLATVYYAGLSAIAFAKAPAPER